MGALSPFRGVRSGCNNEHVKSLTIILSKNDEVGGNMGEKAEEFKEHLEADKARVKADAWERRVEDAAEHADRVFADQEKHLEDKAKRGVKADERTVKHVEHQVEIDAGLAAMHVKHAEDVIEDQVERVERAYEKVDKRVAAGKSDASIARAEKHAEKVEAGAEARVEQILEREGKHLERDAKAAVKHVERGIGKVEGRVEDLGESAAKSAEKYADAVEHVGEEIEK